MNLFGVIPCFVFRVLNRPPPLIFCFVNGQGGAVFLFLLLISKGCFQCSTSKTWDYQIDFFTPREAALKK